MLTSPPFSVKCAPPFRFTSAVANSEFMAGRGGSFVAPGGRNNSCDTMATTCIKLTAGRGGSGGGSGAVLFGWDVACEGAGAQGCVVERSGSQLAAAAQTISRGKQADGGFAHDDSDASIVVGLSLSSVN